MISYIKGIIEDKQDDKIIIENNGIGYNVFMPQSSAETLQSDTEAKIYTYFNVREDAMQLFGFLTKDDLNVFKLLLTVNGIGPKGALAILSTMTADDLRFAVISEDTKAISKAPGVGKKTAQRLLIELKDKLSIEDALKQNEQLVAESEGTGISKEAIEALTSLGYSQSDSSRAVRKVQITEGMNVEQLLKLALKNIF